MDNSEPGPSNKRGYKSLTPEQRKRKTELQRQRRNEKTPAERETFNECMRKRRAEETPDKHMQRNELERQNRVKRRSEESSIERERRNQLARERRATQRSNRVSITHNLARDQSVRIEEFYIGAMDSQCEKCDAFHFEAEKIIHGRNSHFSVCCENGNVSLERLKPYPELLLSWLTSNNSDCKHFREHVRKYNSAFASFGYNPPKGCSPVSFPRGPQAYVIHGQVYHLTPQSLLNDEKTPSYAQLYFLDPEYANTLRNSNSHNVGCRYEVFQELEQLLRSINPFALAYKMMKELMESTPTENLQMIIIKDRTQDPRRYNLPVANEVAVVFTSEDGQPPDAYKRDICVHPKGTSQLKSISICSPNCDPMTYPVLFPHGEPGWQAGRKEDNINLKKQNERNLTLQDFYAYRLQERPQFNPTLHSGKLTQQYIIDAFLKVEGDRLKYQMDFQKDLRVHMYIGLMDFVNTEAARRQLKTWRVCILPSTFIGSKRNLQQNYQDAMTMVAVHGKPDLFITFTCNPKWREITEQLQPYETPTDRPDIVATVFHIKLKELLDDITKKHVLGKVKAFIHVIEFQKRGLPHCHMLFILETEDKLHEIEDFDSVVCAELPDEHIDSELFDIITASMIHGPCGSLNMKSPCMDEKAGVWECTKDFPKRFCNITNTNKNGYPEYKRRDNGRKIQKKGIELDNRWVVPYNPYLSRKYNAHINVEICSTVKSVKYIFKYVYKGHDAAVVQINQEGQGTLNWDEIRTYIGTRYIAAPEAMWRLRAYPVYGRSHTVQRIAVHLPLQHSVVFQDGKEQEALEKSLQKGTSLTAWFKFNSKCPEARQYLYSEMPYHYRYDTTKGEWITRQRNKDKVLPRIYAVSPRDMERYSLRLLLLHVRGARSFEELRTVDGILCETFQQAARMMNLLEDDDVWLKTMEEAVHYQMPSQLRILLGSILTHGFATDAKRLYVTFREHLMEDYKRNFDEETVEQLCLRDIEAHLKQHGEEKSCKAYGLSATRNIDMNTGCTSPELIEAEQVEAHRLISQFHSEQVKAFNSIMDSVDAKSHIKCFFLSGAEGCGKTFVYRALISTIRSRGEIVKVVAPTDLAATLSKNGQTVHSGFGIGIDVDEKSLSKFSYGSKEWEILSNTKLIIWDEISMSTAHLLNAVERSLSSLIDKRRPFGGITIVVGGDFRQQAPVVKHGNRVTIVEACVKSSKWWPLFHELPLTKNMRVNEEEVDFTNWLLRVGSGLNDENEKLEYARIPDDLLCDDIVTSVFGDNINHISPDELSSRAILSPKNDATLMINETILEKLNGEMKTYFTEMVKTRG